MGNLTDIEFHFRSADNFYFTGGQGIFFSPLTSI